MRDSAVSWIRHAAIAAALRQSFTGYGSLKVGMKCRFERQLKAIKVSTKRHFISLSTDFLKSDHSADVSQLH
jgi:hypothetical protein